MPDEKPAWWQFPLNVRPSHRLPLGLLWLLLALAQLENFLDSRLAWRAAFTAVCGLFAVSYIAADIAHRRRERSHR